MSGGQWFTHKLSQKKRNAISTTVPNRNALHHRGKWTVNQRGQQQKPHGALHGSTEVLHGFLVRCGLVTLVSILFW
jgi:hypothetical protein